MFFWTMAGHCLITVIELGGVDVAMKYHGNVCAS